VYALRVMVTGRIISYNRTQYIKIAETGTAAAMGVYHISDIKPQ